MHKRNFLRLLLVLVIISVTQSLQVKGQGKIVINEFLNITGNITCAVQDYSHEFIELRNMGPGAQSLKCFTITNGYYTITLPDITLNPGELFILGGRDTITYACLSGNVPAKAKTNLNWYTCNCSVSSSGSPIPQADPGMMLDNAKGAFLVLYDENGAFEDGVIDQNITLADISSFNDVTTSAGGTSNCSQRTLNISDSISRSTHKLDTIQANTGSGNSYERIVDGGCTWGKETSPTPGVSQGTTGSALNAELLPSTINNCGSSPTKDIFIKITANISFPYTWSVATAPSYIVTRTGSDTMRTPPTDTLRINSFTAGSYAILIQPNSGCDDRLLNFTLNEPTLTINSTYSLSCSGGSASFEVANPVAAYFPMTYTRSYSIDNDFSTVDATVSGSIPSSSSNPDLSFNGMTKGFYKIEFKPAFGCNQILYFEVKDPQLSVQENYSLECTGGNATFEITNSSPETYFPITYTRVYSASTSNFSTIDATLNSTINSNTSNPDISFSNLTKGYYRLIITPANGCKDTSIFEVLEPIPNITTNYTLQCSGGTASFELTTTPVDNYFPLTYTRTFSANSSTFNPIDQTISGTVSASTGSPDIYFQNLTPGYYKMDILSSFGCTRTINFQVIDTLLRPVTPFETTLYCAGGGGTSSTSLGSVRITFSNPPSTFFNYIPIEYTYYITSSPTTIYSGTSTSTSDVYITGLQAGNYSLNLDPAVGCSTTEIPFTIGTCPTLNQILKSFSGKNTGTANEFIIEIDTYEVIEKIHLESSEDGNAFKHSSSIPFQNKKGMQTIKHKSPALQNKFYRLELHDIFERIDYSSVIRITNQLGNIGIKTYPNPLGEYIHLQKVSTRVDGIYVYLTSASGVVLYDKKFTLKSGINTFTIPTDILPKGQYILSMYEISTGERQSATLIK